MKYLYGVLAALFAANLNAMPLLCDIDPLAPCLSDTGDELFSVSDVDGLDDDITSFIIGRDASFSNSAGIYDPLDFTRTLELWDGTTAAGFGSGVVLNYETGPSTYTIEGSPANFLTLDSAVFGMYIDNGSERWFSQAGLNSDGFDHLLTFATEGQGGVTNGFDIVFAWEDINGGGDKDFNDIVYGCIDCTRAAVPAPGPLGLMGAGLIAMGLVARKRTLRDARLD